MYDLGRLPHQAPNWEEWRNRADYYPVYANIFEAVNPKSFMEFGALTGYQIVNALSSAPALRRVAWIDNETYIPKSNALTLANVASYLEAKPREYPLTLSYATKMWPIHEERYDVIHVDGEHTYDGKLRDLTLAFELDPTLVLVDDFWHHPHEVGDAVRALGRPFAVVRTLRGLAILGDLSLIPATVDVVE